MREFFSSEELFARRTVFFLRLLRWGCL